ncbi:MAG: class I SAM-dependent methyltransferase [Solirubrobacteraceae bacterium]
MQDVQIEFDPNLNDPLRWATSMAHHFELLLPCLDVVGARSVVEIGAYTGQLTRVLADWAVQSGAGVVAVDPAPKEQLVALAQERDEVELIQASSFDALPRISMPDVLIIDGDHNYYTVSEELRLALDRAGATELLPLLLFHDVGWPHGRRDDYFDPARIPPGLLAPLVGEEAGIVPGHDGVRPDGLPYPRSAAREGGPRNGVRTAVEDFVEGHDDLQLVVIPAFYGLGAVWHGDVPWAAEIAKLLRPWDRNPLLQRLEENRLHHIVRAYQLRMALWRAKFSRS